MAGKIDFLKSLQSRFYIFDDDKNRILNFGGGKLEDLTNSFFLDDESNVSLSKVDDSYFMNNLFQRGWSDPVMFVTSKPKHFDGELVSGESYHSLRDVLPKFLQWYSTPVLSYENIVDVMGQDNLEKDFRVNLYTLNLPNSDFSRSRIQEISRICLNKNDFTQMGNRSLVNNTSVASLGDNISLESEFEKDISKGNSISPFMIEPISR